MDVAGGDGQGGRGHAGAALLHGGGVGAAVGQDFKLYRYTQRLGLGLHETAQADVADGVSVHDLERRALVQLYAKRLRVGRVAGGADVERDGKVGLQVVGGYSGPTQPQLLLDGEYRGQLVWRVFQLAQGLNKHGAACAVIRGGSAEPPAVQLGRERRICADVGHGDQLPGLLPVPGPYIHVQVPYFCLRFLDRGLVAYYPAHAVGKHHLPVEQHGRLQPAQGRNAQEAAVRYLRDHEPALVHMGGEHDTLRPRRGTAYADKVAERVRAHLVRQGTDDCGYAAGNSLEFVP